MKQPWIEDIWAVLYKVDTCAEGPCMGMEFARGTLVGTYFDNPYKQSFFMAQIGGGSLLDPSDIGDYTVQDIKGYAFNDSHAARRFANEEVDGYKYGAEGPNKRYTKMRPGQDQIPASMHYAVFYNKGEAIHGGPLSVASHGCIHVEDIEVMRRINYHSVMGRTKVHVKYAGEAARLFPESG